MFIYDYSFDLALFPGSSLPLRLHDHRWIAYFSRKVEDVRNIRDTRELNVVVGIITLDESVVIGKVGILAVVTSINVTEESNDTSSNSNAANNDEIILTLQSIRRFRIVSRSSDNTGVGDLATYDLELLNDFDYKSLPITGRCNDHLIDVKHLAATSSIPLHVWKQISPKILLRRIRTIILEDASFEGVRMSTSFGEMLLRRSPTEATFWLATNLPLSIDERVTILEKEYVLEMLIYIFKKVQRQAKEVPIICCRNCDCHLSPAKELFTLEGVSQGTCGSYVNQYGAVHQTVTVKTADFDKIALVGRPQTQDR